MFNNGEEYIFAIDTEGEEIIMSEEMNKELEGQVTAQEVAPEEAAAEKVTAEEPVETMEDFAAELEAPIRP